MRSDSWVAASIAIWSASVTSSSSAAPKQAPGAEKSSRTPRTNPLTTERPSADAWQGGAPLLPLSRQIAAAYLLATGHNMADYWPDTVEGTTGGALMDKVKRTTSHRTV